MVNDQTTPGPFVSGLTGFQNPPEEEGRGPGEGVQETAQPAPDAGDNQDAQETSKTKYRFKSHEEAEEGYRNLQGMATRAQQEAAEYRRKLEEREAREAAEQKNRAITENLEKESGQLYEAAVGEIEELDPEDPEYRKKVAGIWARANSQLLAMERQMESQGITPAKAPQGDQPADRPGQQPQQGFDRAEIERQVNQSLGRVAPEITPDDPLFMSYAARAPAADQNGAPLSLHQQVEWAANETRKYLAGRINRQTQQANQPMGRSSATNPGPGTEKSARTTLASIQQKIQDSRRI